MRAFLTSLFACALVVGCGDAHHTTPSKIPSSDAGGSGTGSREPTMEDAQGGGWQGGTSGSGNMLSGSGGENCAPLPRSTGDSFIGDLVIGAGTDWNTVVPFSRVTGSLVISDADRVELPYLEEVGGDIRAEDSSLVELYLPALRHVGGQVWLYLNWSLREVDLRSLASVSGRVFIHRNIELEALQIDALTDVGELVEINGNLALPQCFLDRVTERFAFVVTTPPPCKACTRSCGVVTAECE